MIEWVIDVQEKYLIYSVNIAKNPPKGAVRIVRQVELGSISIVFLLTAVIDFFLV